MADSTFRKVGKRPATTRVLERVEADHTRLDLFIIDEKNGLENNIPNLSWIDAVNSSIPPRPFKGSRDELKFNLGKNREVVLDKKWG
ncbi:hypothetical protein [Aliivibrio finisterrensis]|uniref:hypothetical protein n=1 Tax=Aliivibrio finisterrensis TaxID=511998 RepID=UPI00142EDB18|nr:hypothetical protein [Aliivibrio finisterrensis]